MSSNLANCIQCGSLFLRTTNSVCPDCLKRRDTKLQLVRDFLRNNRKASIQETVLATDATLNEIVLWLQMGHLILFPDSNITYPCEKCGASIRQGRLCAKCANELKQAFGTVPENVKHRDEPLHQGFLSRSNEDE